MLKICLLSLPVLLAAGCAHQARETSAEFAPLGPAAFSPTSDRSQPRVYADTPTGAGQYAPPSGANTEDWRLAEQLRDMLTTNHDLRSPPVAAVVNQGTVTLKGSVRTVRERDQVHNAVAAVPGVRQVVDEIQIKNSAGSFSTGESKNY